LASNLDDPERDWLWHVLIQDKRLPDASGMPVGADGGDIGIVEGRLVIETPIKNGADLNVLEHFRHATDMVLMIVADK